jgi:hypothetical protein
MTTPAVLFVEAGLSQRKTAKALRTSHTQVQRDTGTNVPPGRKNASKNSGAKSASGTNVPPRLPDGEQAAKATIKSVAVARRRA